MERRLIMIPTVVIGAGTPIFEGQTVLDKKVKEGESGLSRNMGPDIAWFRDPAGNVLAVLEEVE